MILNVNGLGNETKWTMLWSEINRADIICLQEMHLCPEKEYNFHLFAQLYDFFYSHGSTNSSGVCIAVKWNSIIMVTRCGEIKGHLLALDMELSVGNI